MSLHSLPTPLSSLPIFETRIHFKGKIKRKVAYHAEAMSIILPHIALLSPEEETRSLSRARKGRIANTIPFPSRRAFLLGASRFEKAKECVRLLIAGETQPRSNLKDSESKGVLHLLRFVRCARSYSCGLGAENGVGTIRLHSYRFQTFCECGNRVLSEKSETLWLSPFVID